MNKINLTETESKILEFLIVKETSSKNNVWVDTVMVSGFLKMTMMESKKHLESLKEKGMLEVRRFINVTRWAIKPEFNNQTQF